MINAPSVDSSFYTEEDEDIEPKHGTTVQAGWEAASQSLKPKASGDYPNDFRFTESVQLVRFLDNAPFAVYRQHWIDREGKKSFVCLEAECPLCHIVGDTPRGKFAFNVLVLTEENPTVQILTAPPTFARQLQAVENDPRRGPLSKHYWAISRQGTGPQTTYTLDRVRADDLAEEWDLNPEKISSLADEAVKYDQKSIYVTPRAELITVARSLVS
jgi:hypothetical protein